MRTELLDLLLTARREVTAVLGRGPSVGSTPSVPCSSGSGTGSARIVKRAGTKGSDDARALRFVVFLAAGDALTAIEAAAPSAGSRLLGQRPSPAGPHAGAGLLGRPARVLRRAGPEAPGPVPVQGPGRAPAADAAEARGGAALVAPVLGHAPLGARRRGRRVAGALGAAGPLDPRPQRAPRVPGDRRPAPHARRRALLRRRGSRRPVRGPLPRHREGRRLAGELLAPVRSRPERDRPDPVLHRATSA